MHRSGSGPRPSTRSPSFARTRLPQISFLQVEANKHISHDLETYKLPTDLHPLILATEEFCSGLKHKILSFYQVVPAEMADTMDEQVSMMKATYRSLRRCGGVSVREGIMAVRRIMEEIRGIEEEVDERIIAWDRGERRNGGEASGITGEWGSKGHGGRAVRSLKELGKTDNKREKVREIWEKIRGKGWKEGDGDDAPVGVEEAKGGEEEEDEPEGRVSVQVDEAPRSDDGDPPPGFRPIMEWEWDIFQDDNTHA